MDNKLLAVLVCVLALFAGIGLMRGCRAARFAAANHSRSSAPRASAAASVVPRGVAFSTR